MLISDEEVEAFRRSGAFDEQWYLEEYEDVKDTGIDPARHYLWLGKLLGRSPSRIDPNGQTGGNASLFMPSPTASGREYRSGRDDVDPHVYDTIQAAFSVSFYLSSYPDVARAGIDPIWHYIVKGWAEDRDPSLEFSTRFYLENNSDVRDNGLNPFYHFLVSGKAEGRAPRHDLGFRYDILARLRPVAEQIATAKAARSPAPMGVAGRLRAALAHHDRERIIVTFSHDNFNLHVGGVQLLMRREARLLRRHGYIQVNLHPAYPMLFLDTSGEDVLLGVTIDGRLLEGAFRPTDVAEALHGTSGAAPPFFIVHNLLGHNMDQVVAILKAFGARAGYFWIHDFAALYNNYKMMRNDVEYKGVPRPGTLAWELCEYARADFSHPDEYAKLFDEFAIDLLAPSRSTLSIWEEAGILRPRSSQIVEHCTLRELTSSPPSVTSPLLPDEDEAPLRMGFLGHCADLKGWPVFRELVLAFGDDKRYQFYHLGTGRGGGLPLISREVIASEANPDFMRQAVEEEELDVVLVWSLWPETFCLIAYEALAAGAAIVTNESAGNVCDLVRQSGEGLVLRDENDLAALFRSGDIRHLARSRRTERRFAMDYSDLTLEVVEASR